MSWEQRADTMMGVSAAFMALAWVAFSLRAYVKGYVMRSFQADDWTMLVAVVLFTVDGALLVKVGNGERSGVIPESLVTYQIFQAAFYILSNMVVKISLAITFHRLFLENWQRITVYSAVAVHSAFGLGTFFLVIFRCGNPTNFYLHYVVKECAAFHAFKPILYTNSALNTATDWLLTLLPIFALEAMKMNRQIRISAYVILVLGCVSSASSIPRLAFIWALGGTGNMFWTDSFPVAVLSIIEVGVGITAACLLTLRPLIRSWRERHAVSAYSMGFDESEMAEYGQAKAVTIRSIASTEDGTDSIHKLNTVALPAPIMIHTRSIEESPIPSPTDSEFRNRSSACQREFEDIAAANLYLERYQHEPEHGGIFTEVHLSQEALTMGGPHQGTTSEASRAKPWQKDRANRRMSFRDLNLRRLTWQDVHSQWTNLHVSRAAYHGNDEKPKKPAGRFSFSNRLTMLFPHWDDDEVTEM